MSLTDLNNTLVLTGPTGSGKTELGLQVAERLGAEIVSMDSMALYRGMDIGTAKPGAAERARVPHHLIDVLEPWESASVAWWLERALACVREIENRGRQVLFVGGTPLYLKALQQGLFDGPPADAGVRRELEARAAAAGPRELHRELERVDPASAGRLHPHDVRRVVRALEVFRLTGRPISAWQTQWGTPPAVRPRAVWLDVPRQELYRRIDARVLRMVEEGLFEEVEAVTRLPRPLSREARQALGYKEVLDGMAGGWGREEVVRRIQTRSRQFAKRQLTWFRRLPGCRPAAAELTSVYGGLTMSE